MRATAVLTAIFILLLFVLPDDLQWITCIVFVLAQAWTLGTAVGAAKRKRAK